MLRQYLELPRAVHILCLGTFINRAGTFLLPFLAFYLQKRFDWGPQFATRALGAFGFGAILAALSGGHLADRFGRRLVMLTALGGSASILLAFGALGSARSVIAAVFLFGLVGEMYRPASSAMIADLVEPHRRPIAFGLMYVAINLGFAIGPVVGGLLAQRSFQLLFWADAATSLAYAVLILTTIRETLPTNASTSGDVPPQDPRAKQRVALAAAAGHILRDRTFLLFCLASLLTGFVYMQSFSTFPLYLRQLGMNEKTYGRIIAVNGMLIVCFQLPLAWWLSRFDRGRVVAASAVVLGIGFGMTGLARTAWQLAGTVAVWTIGEMMQAAFVSAIVSDLAPPALRARYMGVFSMSYSLAMMIGSPLGGEVMARYGGGYVWWGTSCLGLAAAGLYWLLRKDVAPRPSVSAARVDPREDRRDSAAITA